MYPFLGIFEVVGLLPEKFIHLKQGDSATSEYVSQLNEFVSFGFMLINTLQKKAPKFAKGLNAQLEKRAVVYRRCHKKGHVMVQCRLDIS